MCYQHNKSPIFIKNWGGHIKIKAGEKTKATKYQKRGGEGSDPPALQLLEEGLGLLELGGEVHHLRPRVVGGDVVVPAHRPLGGRLTRTLVLPLLPGEGPVDGLDDGAPCLGTLEIRQEGALGHLSDEGVKSPTQRAALLSRHDRLFQCVNGGHVEAVAPSDVFPLNPKTPLIYILTIALISGKNGGIPFYLLSLVTIYENKCDYCASLTAITKIDIHFHL